MHIGLLQPALLVQHAALEKKPLGIAGIVRYAIQQYLGIHDAVLPDHLPHIGVAGAAAAAVRRGIAAGSGAAGLALPHNGIVGVVDLLHLFLCKVG